MFALASVLNMFYILLFFYSMVVDYFIEPCKTLFAKGKKEESKLTHLLDAFTKDGVRC